MEKTRTLYNLALCFALVFVLLSCGGGQERKLDMARMMMDSRPDSAYMLVREVDFNDLDEDSLRAKYILTRAQVNSRAGRSLITDTLLNEAVMYYHYSGDTANWARASHLLAEYEYARGDGESAMLRIDSLLGRISDQDMLRDTYLHGLELAWSCQDYARADAMADWLAVHAESPGKKLEYQSAKGAAESMLGNYARGIGIYDSIIASGLLDNVEASQAAQFYCEYAELLDGGGRPREAIGVMDSLNRSNPASDVVEKVCRSVTSAHFHADAGDIDMAKALLDSINHEATRSVFEIYTYIGMLKVAIRFKETGHFPLELMRRVTKTVERSYRDALYDRETAMESVFELTGEKYRLEIERQRLWLAVVAIAFVSVVCVAAAYILHGRRKQRLIEAEERTEVLSRMLSDAENVAAGEESEKVKGLLLRQMGILKAFAGTPTPQSREALKRISNAANGEGNEALVDWHEFFLMIDGIYNGFCSKVADAYPGMFNEKELQIIMLLKAGFSTKEIGVLTEQSSATIYVLKTSIRKKLRTVENGDFIAYLEGKFATVESH